MARIEQTFLSSYHCDEPVARVDVKSGFLYGTPGAAELFAAYSGASFEGGLYRLLAVDALPMWNHMASSAFPQFSGRMTCFASDWLGRLFALEPARSFEGQPGIVMFEPGTGKALSVPANFLSFHCEELITFSDAALARGAYGEWRKRDVGKLKTNECVGYEVPLFLGGRDTIDNMKRADMKVYWELCTQLLSQTRALPEGTSVRKISP